MIGQRRMDPTLGAHPIGILSYAGDHFTAQFMKRDRTDESVKRMAIAGQKDIFN